MNLNRLPPQLQRLTRSKFIRDTLILQVSKIGNTLLSVISLAITIRLMGPENFGIWRLILALFGISQAFDLTGVGMATATRLAVAIGRNDEPEILNLLALYVKIGLAWALLTAAALFSIGPVVARALYGPETQVAQWIGLFSLSLIADTLYTMVVVVLQARRSMKTWAYLQNINQLVLTVSVVVAVLLSATPQGIVAGRLFYSYSTMLLAFYVYVHSRASGSLTFPPLGAIFRRAVGVSPRGYWRFGVLLALDKNVSNLYVQVPIALVGVLSGNVAAGFLGVAIDAISRLTTLTSAILDNLQAVVPQSIGRGDYSRLRGNLRRVILVLLLGGIGFYGLVALFAPVAVPLLLGHESAGAAPVVVTLCLYGALVTVGGVFGPLYRALDWVRAALWVKIATGLILLGPGVLLIERLGPVGGAWLIDGLYALSVVGTAAVTLPVLNARADAQRAEQAAQNQPID